MQRVVGDFLNGLPFAARKAQSLPRMGRQHQGALVMFNKAPAGRKIQTVGIQNKGTGQIFKQGLYQFFLLFPLPKPRTENQNRTAGRLEKKLLRFGLVVIGIKRCLGQKGLQNAPVAFRRKELYQSCTGKIGRFSGKKSRPGHIFSSANHTDRSEGSLVGAS